MKRSIASHQFVRPNSIGDAETDFRMLNTKYKDKEINLDEEKMKLEEFTNYLKDDKCTDKLSRGINYLLKESCKYLVAEEAFRINAYDETEVIKILDERRKERDELKNQFSQLMNQICDSQIKKVRYKRLLKSDIPQVIARSSGHPGNKFVLGYGYKYGVGYTDSEKASTAPGFEMTVPDHIALVIKTFGPIKAKKNFDQLYEDIFDIKKSNQNS